MWDASVPITNEAAVSDAFRTWLIDQGWTVTAEVEGADLLALRRDERMVCEVKGITASPGTDADTMYGQLLRRMTGLDDGVSYAVVVPSAVIERALRVPEMVRQRLQISVFAVDESGTVVQRSGSPVQAVSEATAQEDILGWLAASWDSRIDAFLQGGSAVGPEHNEWFGAYAGSGRGAVEADAMPEPWIGPLDPATCRGVMLGLNPGHAHLDFQARDGVFAEEVRTCGGYAAWAVSWPYLRDPWVSAKGPNLYHRSRLGFLRNWTGDPGLSEGAMVVFEMYPWHSTAVTGAMRPDPGVIREWVLDPIRALNAPVFAFGAPWLDLLPKLGLPEIDRLGPGGRSYPTKVASRTVVAYDLDGQVLIAEKHSGSAGPPSRSETLTLGEALGVGPVRLS